MSADDMNTHKNREAEEALKHLSLRYEAILDSVPDIIMEVDGNKVYKWANKAGYDFFGDDVIDKEANYYFEGEQETYTKVIPLFQGSEDVIYIESWQRRKDGKRRLLAWRCRVLKDSKGDVAGALSAAQDITERKKAEEELKKYREHLEELVRGRTAELKDSQTALMNMVEDLNQKTEELGIANERLKELDRLKSMFIASMSHELRTPLNSIIGFTGIILQGMAGEINEEQRDQLQRVSRAGKHLLALITDVIDISKIEAGKIEAYAEEFQIESVLNEAVSNLKLQIREKGLELEVNIIPEKIILKTDRKRLLQCVLNLLSNAVKFTEKGKIAIVAEDKGDIMQLSVTDTGIGIKEEDLPMLFNSFVRLDSPLKMSVSGTGLGLYLTKKLAAEVLGGEVSAASNYGKGSTFMLSIPKNLRGNRDEAHL